MNEHTLRGSLKYSSTTEEWCTKPFKLTKGIFSGLRLSQSVNERLSSLDVREN